jgi:Domain of unknown function (DUF4259)
VGTWDTKTFDNDAAMDWAGELAISNDLSICERSLDPEELRGYYLQAPDCVGILCAAEVLAALSGQPSPDLPEEVQRWVETHGRLDPKPLLPAAIAKLERVIAKHSELDEVWRENQDDYPDWRAGVDDLKARLTNG